jgi:hypothetical protein
VRAFRLRRALGRLPGFALASRLRRALVPGTGAGSGSYHLFALLRRPAGRG